MLLTNKDKNMNTDEVVLSTLFENKKIGVASLTAPEVWHWQIDGCGARTNMSLFDIKASLESLVLSSKIKEKNGFYCETDAEKEFFYKERIDTIKHTGYKWQLIKRKAFFIKYLPFVRRVGVLGSVSMSSAKKDSDIDISIGSAVNYMWIARFFILCVSGIFRVRRHGKNKKDKLCFNHYLGCSNAKLCPQTSEGKKILYKTLLHINHQSITIWEHGIERNPLFRLKDIVEKIIKALNYKGALESVLSKIQIKRIDSKRLYSSHLPKLSTDIQHIIFAHNKIL